MIRYKFEDSFCLLKVNRDDSLTFYKVNHVKQDNAEWFLFQMGRDAQIFKHIIDTGLDNLDINELREKYYNYEEKNIFSLVMKSYIQFLHDWKKDVKVDRDRLLREIYETQKEVKEEENQRKKVNLNLKLTKLTNNLQSIDSVLLDFVNTLIDTRILVEKDTVKIFTNNKEILSILKEVVLKNTHQFKQIPKIEDTYPWWE